MTHTTFPVPTAPSKHIGSASLSVALQTSGLLHSICFHHMVALQGVNDYFTKRNVLY